MTNEYKGDKKIKFDEFLSDKGNWFEPILDSSSWENCEKLEINENGDYDYYLCWDNKFENEKTLYRVKKKKVCKCCGREL